MNFVFIAAGFVMLIAGGELLVRGSVAVARRLRISELVIGVTIVGFGTSAPELVVGVDAALAGSTGITIGNVIGSNMANMLLILGAAAAIYAMPVNRDALRRDATALIAATFIFSLIALSGVAGMAHGLIMLTALAAILAFTLWSDRRTGDAGADMHLHEALDKAAVPGSGWFTAVAAIVAGIALLIAGAEALVQGAVAIARAGGISEEVIGLTLVAFGTSLPELATSIVAAIRRRPDVCIGNVLGSNIFNLLGITGVAAMVTPIAFTPEILAFDLPVLAAATALLMVVMMTGHRISRGEGAGLLLLYTAYIAFHFGI
ncbi:MAG: calcium/sodium antiporter [Alphaproteobacteria bacterium]